MKELLLGCAALLATMPGMATHLTICDVVGKVPYTDKLGPAYKDWRYENYKPKYDKQGKMLPGKEYTLDGQVTVATVLFNGGSNQAGDLCNRQGFPSERVEFQQNELYCKSCRTECVDGFC